MQKIMKSSTAKVVIVKLNDKKSQVTVDSTLHDDIYVEAATRVVERNKKNMAFFHKIRIVAECYEKADVNNEDNHFHVNMYHILLNAGMYSLAELLREKAKNLHKVDLQSKPQRTHVGKPTTS